MVVVMSGLTTVCGVVALSACCTVKQAGEHGGEPVVEPAVDRHAETISLLPGEDDGADADGLAGWHVDVPATDDEPNLPASFEMRDGMLISHGDPRGHCITDASFSDYRLVVEYRFLGEPGNCGVLVHASTPRRLYAMFPQSIEVQLHSGNAGDFWCIGENITVPDMASRRDGEPETWGGGPDDSRHIRNLTDGSEHAVGQWNTMVIECLGDRVTVWVNGDLVNDGYDATATQGRIALQAEGAAVAFRRLDLTELGE